MTDKGLLHVKYVIVCDDIREEKSNKAILIGVYSERVIVKALPTLLPKLAFRICFDIQKSMNARFMFSVKKPDGKYVGPPFPMEIKSKIVGLKEAYVNIILSPFVVDLEGNYGIYITVDDKEQKIGEFSVSIGKGEEKSAQK